MSQVVKGVRQSVTKLGLGGSKGTTLTNVAGYLYRNRTRTHYNQYLEQGLPIASGPVEGACKILIKDRMERSGMRWTEGMAEAIVKLRAIYLSGDFGQYWPFHIQKDQVTQDLPELGQNDSILLADGASSKSRHTQMKFGNGIKRTSPNAGIV